MTDILLVEDEELKMKRVLTGGLSLLLQRKDIW